MTAPNLSVVMGGTLQCIPVAAPKRQPRKTEGARPELPFLHRHTKRLRFVHALEHQPELTSVTPNMAPWPQRPFQRTERLESPRQAMKIAAHRIFQRSMKFMKNLVIRNVETKLRHCQTFRIRLLVPDDAHLGADDSKVNNQRLKHVHNQMG